jgi:hypothetical protein
VCSGSGFIYFFLCNFVFTSGASKCWVFLSPRIFALLYFFFWLMCWLRIDRAAIHPLPIPPVKVKERKQDHFKVNLKENAKQTNILFLWRLCFLYSSTLISVVSYDLVYDSCVIALSFFFKGVAYAHPNNKKIFFFYY